MNKTLRPAGLLLLAALVGFSPLLSAQEESPSAENPPAETPFAEAPRTEDPPAAQAELNNSLRAALGQSDTKRVRELLDAGADPAALDPETGEPLIFKGRLNRGHIPLLVERGLPADFCDKNGKTLLMIAADFSDVPLMRFLLDAGADPNIAGKDGKTALMYASDMAAAAMLLESGADPLARDNRGDTALHHRFYSGKGTLLVLVNAGVPLDSENNRGLTPLMRAVQSGRKGPVLNLVELGADPLKRSGRGETLLLLYLKSNSLYTDTEMVKQFLDWGIDPALADDTGNSPLLTALREKDGHGRGKVNREAIIAAAEKEALAAARREIREENKERFAEEAPAKIQFSLPVLIPLAHIGLSIWTREGIYRSDPGNNWMARVNSSLTLGTGFAAAGFFTVFTLTGGRDGGWDAIGAAVFGFGAGIVGFVAGAIVGQVPAVRSAFAENPWLYYLPSAGAGIITGITLFHIWRR